MREAHLVCRRRNVTLWPVRLRRASGEAGTVTRQERSRRARAKWQRLVSEQGRSAQNVAAFCREHRLCVPHFYWWKKRLGESSGAKWDGASRFVEVKVAAAPDAPGGAQIEIRLRNGRSAWWWDRDLTPGISKRCWRRWKRRDGAAEFAGARWGASRAHLAGDGSDGHALRV